MQAGQEQTRLKGRSKSRQICYSTPSSGVCVSVWGHESGGSVIVLTLGISLGTLDSLKFERYRNLMSS